MGRRIQGWKAYNDRCRSPSNEVATLQRCRAVRRMMGHCLTEQPVFRTPYSHGKHSFNIPATPCRSFLLSQLTEYVAPFARLTMRYAGYTARAAAVGTLAAVSCSIVTEAFVTAPSFHAAVHHHRRTHNDKLRFASNGRQPTALASTSTSLLQAAGRWRCIRGRRPMNTTSECPLGSSSTAMATGLHVSGVTRRSSERRPRATTATDSSMSTDGGAEDVLNPLARGDPERARVNHLITILAETPMNQWKPAILDEYMSSLLKQGLYRQAMTERMAKVRSGEDQEALTRVDAYLTGYLGQESRRASRKKVRGERSDYSSRSVLVWWMYPMVCKLYHTRHAGT